MFHHGRPVSYVLLRSAEGVLLYEYLGYDPSYGKWSIGSVLHRLMIEELFREAEYRILDFTEGEGEQKRQFGSQNTLCANVYCLKPTMRLKVLLRLHDVTNAASGRLGDLLDWLDLRSTARKLVRRLG